MNFEDPMAEAYAKNDGMDKIIEDNAEEAEDYSEALKDIPNADDKIDSLEETETETETEIDNNPDSLGEAYARDRDEKLTTEETVGDNEEPVTEVEDRDEDSSREGYNDLKEAYEKDNGMKEVAEENEESVAEKDVSFKEVGREKWTNALEKASSFSSDLIKGGKEAIYTATGVAFELPKIANETKEVAIEAGTQAYGEAKEVFTGAVNSAKEKVQEVKTSLIEGVEKAKKSFFEKITRTKDEYIDKAVKLTARGAVWGIDKGIEVSGKIVKTYNEVTETMHDIRIETLKNEIEKGEGNLEDKKVRLEIFEKEKEARKKALSVKNALERVGELTV